jgi:hypothetical protein
LSHLFAIVCLFSPNAEPWGWGSYPPIIIDEGDCHVAGRAGDDSDHSLKTPKIWVKWPQQQNFYDETREKRTLSHRSCRTLGHRAERNAEVETTAEKMPRGSRDSDADLRRGSDETRIRTSTGHDSGRTRHRQTTSSRDFRGRQITSFTCRNSRRFLGTVRHKSELILHFWFWWLRLVDEPQW